jgi:monoterpene epsilon-lactone hydrolase
MPSWQARTMTFFMRNRHWLQLRARRPSWDEHTSIPQFRADCERYASQLAKMPPGVEVLPASLPALVKPLAAEWIVPAGAGVPPLGQAPLIFYVHGGGFVSGSCSDHRMHVAHLVLGSGLPALLFEYRLAPEHPFPAGLEDVLAAYRWLLEQGIRPGQVIFAGESAGGTLLLAALLALRDAHEPLPAAGVALSPLTDFTFSGESHRSKARVCLSPPGMNEVCAKHYLHGQDPTQPYASPLFGDLHGLPPLLIYTGDDETLRDDATRFAAKAVAAGVEVQWKIEPGMVHCYPLLPAFIPEARQAMDEICVFIRTRVPDPAAAQPGEAA